MAKYAITVNETVVFQHLLIVDCDTFDEAEELAASLYDESFEHKDDVSCKARELGAKVVRMEENYNEDTDSIEIDDVWKYGESEEE